MTRESVTEITCDNCGKKMDDTWLEFAIFLQNRDSCDADHRCYCSWRCAVIDLPKIENVDFIGWPPTGNDGRDEGCRLTDLWDLLKPDLETRPKGRLEEQFDRQPEEDRNSIEYWQERAQIEIEGNEILQNEVAQLKLFLKEWRKVVCVDTGKSETENGECPVHHGDACLTHWAAREWRQRAEKAEEKLDELERGKREEKASEDET